MWVCPRHWRPRAARLEQCPTQNHSPLNPFCPLLLDGCVRSGRLLRHLLGTRQLRTIPTAAQSFDQRYCGSHFLHVKVIQSLLRGQERGLRDQHLAMNEIDDRTLVEQDLRRLLVDRLALGRVVLLPEAGGGLEGPLGPVGIRFDIGDEMYFNSGTHNNLRIAFGPYIRF